MRILVISNYYPPHNIGGYELACRDVAGALAARGHIVQVLTSTYGLWRQQSDGGVWRWLRADMDPEGYVQRLRSPRELFSREWVNRAAFRRAAAVFKPDLVYAWNMTDLSFALLPQARRLGLPLAYYVSDHWLAKWTHYDRWLNYWKRPAPRRRDRWGRAALRQVARALALPIRLDSLDLCHVQFASEYLKHQALAAGRLVAEARVIHHGVDVRFFSPPSARPWPPRRLLYAGQLAPHKGVHTALEALRILRDDHSLPEFSLTLAGGTVIHEYEAGLRRQTEAAGLARQVHFAGPRSREQMPTLYREHDLLLFPSVWEEPFSITLLEALACGLPVVGTTTGGSPEILEHEVTGLVFPPEDAAACAGQVRRLLADPALYGELSRRGRAAVEQRFQQTLMVDRIEQALLQSVTRDGAGGA